MKTCKTHPTYKANRPPNCGCVECTDMYVRKQQAKIKACVSAGTLRSMQLQIEKLRHAVQDKIEVVEHDATVRRLTSHVGKYYENDYGGSISHFLFVIGVDGYGQRNHVLEIGTIYGDKKEDPWLSFELHDSSYQMEDLKPATKEQFDAVMTQVKDVIKRHA